MMQKRGFKGIWIPKDIWLNEDLSVMEKLFLVEIDSLDNEKGCFASNKHFSEFFDLSKGRCTQIIKDLEEKGLVTITYEREGKAITKRIIRVVNKLNTPYNKLNRGSKNIKQGYLENDEDNNTSNSNTRDSNTTNKEIESGSSEPDDIPYKLIIDYLNEKSGRKYSHSAYGNKKLIKARWNEGFRLDDFKKVIDNKKADADNPSTFFDEKYLRPATLFSNKFDDYLNEVVEDKSESVGEYDDLF